ncbi:MAG: glycosyltransferase family 39 protein [Nanoarchaeota archaeon]
MVLKYNLIKEKINYFFHSNESKYARYTLYLTLIGLVLRFIGAIHLDVLADDMVYASQSAGIIGSKIISTHSNPPLFFYLTDLAYNIFGYSTFAARFWPMITGTLLIPLIYLISNHLLKNRKQSFFVALFVTFSSFLIRMTFTEQSLVVFFFIFAGVYFGMLFMEKQSHKFLLLSSVFFGLALLTKYNAPFFIISFGIYAIYSNFSKNNKFLTLKNTILFIGILVLFALPFLSFNYILYDQKGIVDVYFSRLVHLDSTQELYGGLGGQEKSFLDNLFNPGNYGNYKLPLFTDPLLVLFALYGLFLFYLHNKKAFYFILIFLLIPFVLQSAGAPLQKHFAFMYILLAIPAGLGFSTAISNLKSRNLKIISLVVFLLIAIYCLGISNGTPSHYFAKGPNAGLKYFINDEVSDSSLIVFDSRIYTARLMWLATDKAYLTFEQSVPILQQVFAQNISSVHPMKVYFIECVVEDCGWGWVASNQNLNSSSEYFIDSISETADVVSIIESPRFDGNELFNSVPQEYYKVYSVDLRIPQPALEQIKQSQSFYFVPYLYKNMENYLYNYKTIDPFSDLLDNSSYAIIIASIILAILCLIFVIFVFLIFS